MAQFTATSRLSSGISSSLSTAASWRREVLSLMNCFKEKRSPSTSCKTSYRCGNVGYEAFSVILNYLYSANFHPFAPEVATCVDAACDHEACRPAIEFSVQLMYASHIFRIPELFFCFETDLLACLKKITEEEDIDPILMVAYHCKSTELLDQCVKRIVMSDLDAIFIQKRFPGEVVDQIKLLGRMLQEDYEKKRIKGIRKALDEGDIELVKIFLSESENVLDEANALHYAVEHCRHEVIKKLLVLRKADVNRRNSRGYTVLHLAARKRDPLIILALIENGASPWELSPDGKTAVSICSRMTTPKDYNVQLDDESADKEACKNKRCLNILSMEITAPSCLVSICFALQWGDRLCDRLIYLERRVCDFVRSKFPVQLERAIKLADAGRTLEFTANLAFGGYRKGIKFGFSMASMMQDDRYLQRLKALTKIVETAKTYFPDCFKIISKLMEEEEGDTPYEQKRKNIS